MTNRIPVRWIENEMVTGEVLLVQELIDALGDHVFVECDDKELLLRCFTERKLFGFAFDGKAPLSLFADAENKKHWHLKPTCRRALERIKRLRMAWADGLLESCGLIVVGSYDGRWARRVSALVILAAQEMNAGSLNPKEDTWIAIPPQELLQEIRKMKPIECKQALGKRASQFVAEKFQTIVISRKVMDFLRSCGLKESELASARMALYRESVYIWPWAQERLPSRNGLLKRKSPDTPLHKQVFIPNLASANCEETTMRLPKPREIARIDLMLGGQGRFVTLLQAFVDTIHALAKGRDLSPVAETIIKALGYTRINDGRITGSLAPRYDLRLVRALVSRPVWPESPPDENALLTAIRTINRVCFEAAGLIQDASVAKWTGGGCALAITQRVRQLAVEKQILELDNAHREYNKQGFACSRMACLGRVKPGRTVYHDIVRPKMLLDHRALWDKVAARGDSSLTNQTTGAQRLISTFDGLAAGFISAFELADDFQASGGFAHFMGMVGMIP